ncbi:MAG: 1-acyl-sn-glycerol-3-phosphate acyltransferase [Lachnospiraceae bacterium]|nr:1-acyl-sn-glycerol-3-phosphate acyltransferase [Lachnospiraceae bacterium]
MDAFNFERFDMTKPPIRTRWFLRPLTWLLSVPSTISHRTRITKTGTEGLKAPYLMLCNHNSFMDFKVLTKAVFPQRCNYVVAIDGFIGREWLLRNVGGICKRKFTNDLRLIKQLHQVIDNGDVAVIYPEARYSLCGTTAILPESLGKFCKHLGVPVVTFICHGNHVTAPFWNIHERKIRPTEAEMTLLFTPEQLKAASAEEINARLVEAFQYDDFAWQKARGLKTKYKKRAEGLHKVLYQCPACKTEFRMNSSEDRLFCEACGKTWVMDETGQLSASEGGTEFPHIPDWYEWERANVRAEVEAGTYTSGVLDVHVDSLPNAKGYVRLGNGTMVHDYNGFRVAGKDEKGRDFSMEIPVPDLYSLHIEYEYLGKYGDCVDLNTIRDTWYVYPHGKDFAITKMALATEELYKKNKRDAGKECKPGLA